MNAPRAPSPGSEPIRSDYARELHDEHAALERRFTDIAARARGGDWHDLDEVWHTFEADLERHMSFEEADLFDAFIDENPDQAETAHLLRDDHGRIRSQLDRLGLEIQLHEVRADSIDQFLSALREHAERENQSFYPWLKRRAGAA